MSGSTGLGRAGASSTVLVTQYTADPAFVPRVGKRLSSGDAVRIAQLERQLAELERRLGQLESSAGGGELG